MPGYMRSRGRWLWLAVSAVAGVQDVSAQTVQRYSDPRDDFPISAAVKVQAGAETVYVSGLGPAPDRASGTTTAEQTQSALDQISAALGHFGMTLRDVVQMHVYLVADPRLGHMDFAGMMKAYQTRFRSGFPARTVIEVPHLTNPDWLVEIDVIASRNGAGQKRFPAQ
ncbi:translation initiation inhibitor [Gluconobacter morbifer G707]|uniref:Translation initiation inhibitor n=1 Tax=Gluconobacter morbifer G707 TaxID=1088869 RepID=G6XHE8_9PROT|nr:translation initiation inhibitor [Gluconobacter morbifer G707]